ncbi:Phosphoglycolate phosphatase [Sedimentisphaera cyanobacteriorum]|uniref:phosphoglycolate phosphatase n=1 Tax=Sedimentisphaera cyanobacteriorum TaxID=1940790 RepID=A0A1Q2HS47_9BACT|nr:HAD family hydrolase [Sedimentisphaera cyanobacteriorum]AQQ10094.1 Phosphoglycolate phosphatase [Sedimentisphaera cyanobacteriorum]
MQYDTVLFDLDGTLIDTVEDLGDTMNKALKEFGFPTITYEQCRMMLGIGLRHFCESALPEGKKGMTDEVMTVFREIYNDNFCEKTKPYDGIPELLNWLRERKFKLAVITNKNEDISSVIVEKIFGDGVFGVVRGAQDGIGCKPQPAPAMGVLELLGSSPEKTLFVGDGETDVETAKNCGFRAVWVNWGFRAYEELGEHKPDDVISSPEELKNIIETG